MPKVSKEWYNRKCSESNCSKRPSFGFPDGKAVRCKTHVLDGMEDVIHHRCSEVGCSKLNPTYGVPGERPSRCKTHSLQGMEDISNPRCTEPGCKTRATRGSEVGVRPMYCMAHGLPEMGNIVSPRCTYPECRVISPVFDFQKGKGTRCKLHKMDGMVDVRCTQWCEYPNCTKHASFGVPPSGRPTRCSKHRLAGMDIIYNKRCEETGCNKHPVFGVTGGRPTHCKIHRLDGMEDVHSKRCGESGCKTSPVFGFPGGKSVRCKAHALEGMVDVCNKKCIGPVGGDGCPLGYRTTPGLEHCAACDPDPIRARKFRRNEFRFFETLTKEGLLFQREVPVSFACERRGATEAKSARLDGVMCVDGLLIIAELDEFFHEAYEARCEAARQNAATFSIRTGGWNGHIAWVRVNPHRLNGKPTTIPFERTQHAEAALIIRDLLQNPRDGVFYVNYPLGRIVDIEDAGHTRT